ncbi:MAG: acyltransferase [Eubacterium sp.]|nr:acyltransferase [Eubacterium sp.]
MSKRYLHIDYIKGLCILLVIVSHTIHFTKEYALLSDWMQVVFLRGFFFATGWIYANREKTGSLIRKTKKFVIQYFVLSAAVIIIQQLLSLFVGTKDTYIELKGTTLLKTNVLNTISFNGVGTLWFLPIIFVGSVCVILLLKIKNKKIQYILAAISVVICFVIQYFLDQYNPSNAVLKKEIIFVDRILMAISMVMIGFLVGSLNKVMKLKSYLWLLLAIVFWGAGFGLCQINLYFPRFALYVLSLYALMMALASVKALKKPLLALEWLGINSLYIMVIHYFLCVPILANIFNAGGLDLKSLPIRILLWAIVLAVSVVITLIIKKFKCVKFVFGETPQLKNIEQ